jgi:hypothetical protein
MSAQTVRNASLMRTLRKPLFFFLRRTKRGHFSLAFTIAVHPHARADRRNTFVPR